MTVFPGGRFQLRRDTAANWTSVNPVLKSGEPGVETDTRKWKVGDGTTAWTGLSYMEGASGGASALADLDDVDIDGTQTFPAALVYDEDAGMWFAFHLNHGNLANIGADDHHNENHIHDGADQSAVAHIDLTFVGANDHHNKSHGHDEGDTGTVSHPSLNNVTADQHHAQAHGNADHTTAFAASAALAAHLATENADHGLEHNDLNSVGADDHHAQVHGNTEHSTAFATAAALSSHLATENADHGLEHNDLNSVGANDHHAQSHGNADHTTSYAAVADIQTFNAPTMDATVAHDATSESHTGTTPSTSEASFQWTHTPVGTPRVVVVMVFCTNTATDLVTGVTYGGTAMTAVTGGRAVDTAGEPGSVKAYVLSAPAAGAQTVVVTRTNNANEMYATATTWTGTVALDVFGTPSLVQEDSSGPTAAVSSGRMKAGRMAGLFSGLGAVPAATTNCTNQQSILIATNRCAVTQTYDTASTGQVTLGWAGASDDVAAVFLMIAPVTLQTWTKPTGAKTVHILSHGGGGSGGAGGRGGGTSANAAGGGGGGGGGHQLAIFNAADLPSTLTVVVGQGAKGADAKASAGTGDTGNVGLDSTVLSGSSTITGAKGGAAGVGGVGNQAAPTGGNGGTGGAYTGVSSARTLPAGATGTTGAGATGTMGDDDFGAGGGAGGGNGQVGGTGGTGAVRAAGGGAGGGGGNSNTGGVGGVGAINSGAPTGGTAGAGGSAGSAGGTGSNGVGDTGGAGGGGGGGNIAAGGGENAWAGGLGGTPGGGGGGGGGRSVAGQSSGAGGDGAHGRVVITTYF